MALGLLMPDTLIKLDSSIALKPTSVWAVKLKASGVVSAASVVELNCAETPPMVSVVVVVVA